MSRLLRDYSEATPLTGLHNHRSWPNLKPRLCRGILTAGTALRHRESRTDRRAPDDGLYFGRGDAMTVKVGLYRSEEGFSVFVPGLPGCWSQGTTEEEALANIQDAVRDYLAAAAELLHDAEVREVDIAV